jgi:hypothetical protein
VRLGILLAVALVAAGCSSGGGRSVLHEGIVSRTGAAVPISDHEAADAGRLAQAAWRKELEKRARRHPAQRFDNPARGAFQRRLHQLAGRYGFEVVSAKVLRPRQDAPLVVVRTTDYRGLAKATSAILNQLDRKRSTGGDRTGWRYEGFFWEARDERGVPFLIASTLTRGLVEGQQWARSEALYPFTHG